MRKDIIKDWTSDDQSKDSQFLMKITGVEMGDLMDALAHATEDLMFNANLEHYIYV